MWDLIVSVPDHCLSFYFTCILLYYPQTQTDFAIIYVCT